MSGLETCISCTAFLDLHLELLDTEAILFNLDGIRSKRFIRND